MDEYDRERFPEDELKVENVSILHQAVFHVCACQVNSYGEGLEDDFA